MHMQREDVKRLEEQAELIRQQVGLLMEKFGALREGGKPSRLLERFMSATKGWVLAWLRALPYLAAFLGFLVASSLLNRRWRTLGLSVDQYIALSAIVGFLLVASAFAAGIALFRRKTSLWIRS